MVVFPSESNVLARHPVKSSGYIPGFIWISGILGEVGCSRSGCRTVDRRQQDQVAPGIVDLPATDSQTILIVIEPEAVVEHIAKKALLGTLRRITGTADTAAMFTSHVAGERERGFVQESFRIVVVLDLNAVVRLDAHAIEEPRSIGRDVRRLISPVIKLVVAEQAHIRHEDTGIDIHPMQYVEMVATVGLGKIPIGGGEVPLAAGGTRVVARRGLGVQPKLRH